MKKKGAINVVGEQKLSEEKQMCSEVSQSSEKNLVIEEEDDESVLFCKKIIQAFDDEVRIKKQKFFD